MNTILVPTDFSETATNAINYAAELALFTKSKLLLLHVNYIPLAISDLSMEIAGGNYLLPEENYDDRIEQIAAGIKKKWGENFQIDYCSTVASFITDGIALTAEENKCDLIIMGTHGASEMNKLFGSNTVGVIKETKCPVLVIPINIKFQKIHKIVFATNYEELQNKFVFNPILEIASLFESEILIFNMEDANGSKSLNNESAKLELENVFKDLKHSYRFSENINIVDAINDFASNNEAVLITMIRRQHNLFHRIFTTSNTKLMALYTHFPLLILNE
jgi:nucleotide-binding universal stress UspA family protein